MDKISVTVRIPALSNDYDFMVPSNMSISDIKNLIIRILESEYGIVGATSNLMLYVASDASALRNECSLKQMGVSDGEKLVLM